MAAESNNSILGIFLARLIWLVVLLAGGMALIYTPLLSWRLLKGEDGLQGWIIGFAALLITLALLWSLRSSLSRGLLWLKDSILSFSAINCFLFATLLGIVLRLIWFLLFPAQPVSDELTYFNLAQQLAAGGAYEIANTHAYWPPGYPFLLAGLMRIFGSSGQFIVPFNLFLFVLSLWALFELGRKFEQEAAARLGIFLLALWPGYFSAAGLFNKELVLIALLPLILLLHAHGARRGIAPLPTALAGLLLGGCALVQPSLMLFPAVLLGCDILQRVNPARCTIRLIILVTAAVLVVLPWSLRNYETFQKVVPISTNGGDVLYRANNELATGGYTQKGKVDLSGLSELEMDRMGKQLALTWIRDHPGDFLRLAVEKQILFMGDAAGGIYVTLRRALPDAAPSKLYIIAKAGANLYWMGIWAMILVVAWHGLRGGFEAHTTALMLPFLYFFALHSIFESSAKHHSPVWALLALTAGLSLALPRVESK